MVKRARISKSGILITVVVTLAVAVAIVVVFRMATMKEESGLGKVFTYDLGELPRTDPALIKYEEADKIETRFQEVFAITVDSEDLIYVAGDKSIRVFSNNGDVLPEIKLTDVPRCLTVDSDGTMYVGIEDHIEVYNSAGERKAKWESPGQNAILTSIAVSGSDIFAADASGRVVLRYDSSGNLASHIGEKDEARNIPGFVIPSPYFDLAVASDGLLRVANPGLHRIEAYTFDGDLEFSWGESSNSIEGFCGCCNPVNFAILPDGRFVTCEKGLPRVKVYSAEGVFESVVAGTELFTQLRTDINVCRTEKFFAPDVAVDSRGRIMILDPSERAVRIFTEI